MRKRILSIPVLATVVLSAPLGAQAQQAPLPTFDLAHLFDLGGLASDLNGDSVPDFVNASLVMGNPASSAELRAAAEIAARLGFETMALDLPISRGPDADRIPIVFGDRGLAESGFSVPVVSLSPGEGMVSVRETEGRRWVLLLGGDDAGLESAARTLAGVLPHTQTLSTPHLSEIRDDLDSVLTASGITTSNVRFPEARVRSGQSGIARLVADVFVDDADVAAATDAIQSLADQNADDSAADSIKLVYAGLANMEVRIASSSGTTQTVLIAAGIEPEPGPIPGRPGNGAKKSMDLSNLYTREGLLGDSDQNLIPDRIDALLVPSDSAIDRLPDVAARLGLQSTGLVVPLVQSAIEIDKPASQPTMILTGIDHPLIATLTDSGKVDLSQLQPGEGILQLVPKAFGEKPALVVTGADEAGADRAQEQLAETLPHINHRGKDRPTVDDVEYELWSTLSGRTPAGQASIGLYKLDRIAEQLQGKDLASVDVMLSVEKPDSGLASIVRQRMQTLGADHLEVRIDNRDVQNAANVFEDNFEVPSEVDRFWKVFREQILPTVSSGTVIRVEARLSEPPAVRLAIAQEAQRLLIDHGADSHDARVTVLSAFKQGYSWLYDHVRPRLVGQDVGEIVIRFRRNNPPEDWPQQSIHTPVRWLHEIFPIDEVFVRELDIELDQIRFEMTEQGPTYEVLVTNRQGDSLLTDTFEPMYVLRPYFDRFRDYEHVRVTTGWIEARHEDRVVVSERIVTDPEWFWDHYQSQTLPKVYEYVMDRHQGKPRGGARDAPFFGELVVELELSEPDYRLGVDNELISPMDAVHEEVYFGTIEFFHLIGRNARGQDLTHPGRVIPIMRPKNDGTPGQARIRFSGFATARPAVVVTYQEQSGAEGELRLDIPKVAMARPSARRAKVQSDQQGLTELELRVRVDTEFDNRDSLLTFAAPEQVDEQMISAEQVAAAIKNLGLLRGAGMYESALAFPDLGNLVVRAEWTHEDDSAARQTVTLAANGTPSPLPDWSTLIADDWEYTGQRLVQWDTPIPPPEGHRMLAQMAHSFDEATAYKAGESYLGKPIWAMDLMPKLETSHWSQAKATTFKPTVVYSARQHANEVSSTSHVLRHAELILTNPEQRKKLDRVNVVIHPFTNPDGAQLAYDLYRVTPDFILHAGYLASLGMDPTSGSGEDFPIYPEAKVRPKLWQTWLPDVFLNPHGYPSHQVVQLFSEYTGLVRRGRVTERNWGFNKGWFMPGFGYVDDPEYPRHKDAALSIRDYITRGINSNSDVFEMNQRNYKRYERYGADFDPEVFRLPMVDSVLIQMPLKGSRGRTDGPGFSPKVTIWSGTTEAPDETAYGAWMELVAKAGLSWDQAILDYLYEGAHQVERSGSKFFGGVTLKMDRPRPPKAGDNGEKQH